VDNEEVAAAMCAHGYNGYVNFEYEGNALTPRDATIEGLKRMREWLGLVGRGDAPGRPDIPVRLPLAVPLTARSRPYERLPAATIAACRRHTRMALGNLMRPYVRSHYTSRRGPAYVVTRDHPSSVPAPQHPRECRDDGRMSGRSSQKPTPE